MHSGGTRAENLLRAGTICVSQKIAPLSAIPVSLICGYLFTQREQQSLELAMRAHPPTMEAREQWLAIATAVGGGRTE